MLLWGCRETCLSYQNDWEVEKFASYLWVICKVTPHMCLSCINAVSGLCSFGVYLIINLSVLSLGKSSPAPKMVIVQKPIVPPPPPPRKPQSTIPNGGLIPEKPPQSPSTGMQSTVLPNQPLEDNGTATSNHACDFFIVIFNESLLEDWRGIDLVLVGYTECVWYRVTVWDWLQMKTALAIQN